MLNGRYLQNYLKWVFFFVILAISNIVNAVEIKMSEVRELSKLPVKDIFINSAVTEIDQASYWNTVMQSPKPVVVMFYSNQEKHSQNLATLLRYVAIDYSDKILFCSFMVVAKGKPNQSTMIKMERTFSLDKTPGVLYYDNDTGKMILEHEHYEVPKLKEYRTPSMVLWKLYYSKVKQIIENKILD